LVFLFVSRLIFCILFLNLFRRILLCLVFELPLQTPIPHGLQQHLKAHPARSARQFDLPF